MTAGAGRDVQPRAGWPSLELRADALDGLIALAQHLHCAPQGGVATTP